MNIKHNQPKDPRTILEELRTICKKPKKIEGKHRREEVKQRVSRPLGILQEIYRAQWQWSISNHVSSSEEDFHRYPRLDLSRNFREGVEERLPVAAAVRKKRTRLEE
ncbi:hypothetical protein BTUL_0074g00110 [Botrytis tulipae]|uniref:Uncharacterized protein n=1 Tax=Botrytis tulipae TaxID=87230 RepID=A0A4Z1ELK0_9HELO|nr:hypothetical protein BTUL_0074g00110 [Botrytis tulipae]